MIQMQIDDNNCIAFIKQSSNLRQLEWGEQTLYSILAVMVIGLMYKGTFTNIFMAFPTEILVPILCVLWKLTEIDQNK